MTREELIAALEKSSADTVYYHARVDKAALEYIKELEAALLDLGVHLP